MTVYDAFGVKKKHNTMSDTWGHFYPQHSSKHKGKIYISTGEGSTCMMGRDFPTLCGSPIEYSLVCSAIDYVSDKYQIDSDVVAMYELECTLHFFKGCNDMYLGEQVGRIIKPKLKVLWSNE